MQFTHRDLLNGVDFLPSLGVPRGSLGDPWPQSGPSRPAPKATQITSEKWGRGRLLESCKMMKHDTHTAIYRS